MTSQNISLGNKGEQLARHFLEKKGYKILTANYRTPRGEIDLVARQGKTLVFIEVKTRRTITHGHPFEAVTKKKQQQLSRIAQEYLCSIRDTASAARFDVVGIIYHDNEKKPEIELVVNAFDMV